jgi:hypothetical protein
VTDHPPVPGEPTQASLEHEFPLWKAERGTDDLCHARRTVGAASTATGEDWLDLRDQIIRAEAKLERERPKGWQ